MSYLPPYTFVNSIKKFDSRTFSENELKSLADLLFNPISIKSAWLQELNSTTHGLNYKVGAAIHLSDKKFTKSELEKFKQFFYSANLQYLQKLLDTIAENIETHTDELFSENNIDSSGRTEKELFSRHIYEKFIKYLISARSNAGKQEIILAAEEVDKIVVLSKYNHHLLLDYRPTTGWIEYKKVEIRQIELEQKVKRLFSSSNSEKQAEIRKQFPDIRF
jgi:hypothetical protein